MHISELHQGRVNKTTDVVNVGDAVKVKVLGFDDRGKVKLSMRVVDQATGADITEQVGAEGRARAAKRGGATVAATAASTAASARPRPTPRAQRRRRVRRMPYGRGPSSGRPAARN